MTVLAAPLFFMYSGTGDVSAAEGYYESSTTVQYHCESVTNFDMPVTITATVPESVKPGEEFTLMDSSTEVTLPEDVVGTLRDLLQAEKIKGDATQFNIISENEDNTVNVAEDPISIPETDVPDSGTLSFKVPGEGGVDAGPIKAGEEGQVTIKPGSIDTNLVAVGLLGETPIAASCSPIEPDTVLNKIAIKDGSDSPVDEESPVITLNGDKEVTMEVGETYEEPGATAEDDVDGDVTDSIEIDGEVNTDKPGEYTITYTVTDEAGNEATETRTVIVKEAEEGDAEAPVITLNGDKEMTMEVGETYEEPGATAEDNVDGDVSDQIDISGEVNTDEPGEYTITYTVTDEAGNEAIETRTVIVKEAEEGDTEAPVITLNGDEEMELEVGETYEEPGATAEDNVDGDVSDQIDISGEVNTDEPGEYEITYTVTDEAGNTGTATRLVTVVEADDPGDGGEDGDKSGGMWYSGEGAPADDIGDEGDFYLDEETGDYYKKTDEDWVKKGNLGGEDGEDGKDGEDGATWLVGEGEPGAEVGAVGDLYLDNEFGDVYLKSDNGWDFVTNLKGDQGDPGEKGEKGDQGPPGDCDCDDNNNDDADNNGNVDNGSKVDNSDHGSNGEGMIDRDNTTKTKDGELSTTDVSHLDSNDHGSNGDRMVDRDNTTKTKGGELPNTASNTPMLLLIGGLMIIVGGALVFIRKKVLQ